MSNPNTDDLSAFLEVTETNVESDPFKRPPPDGGEPTTLQYKATEGTQPSEPQQVSQQQPIQPASAQNTSSEAQLSLIAEDQEAAKEGKSLDYYYPSQNTDKPTAPAAPPVVAPAAPPVVAPAAPPVAAPEAPPVVAPAAPPVAAPEAPPVVAPAAPPVAAPASDPFSAAMAEIRQNELDKLLNALRGKPAVFKYRQNTDQLDDTEMTFESLRRERMDDFIELQDRTAVSWTVEYGKIKKSPSDTKKILEIKKEIEDSKEFKQYLKAAKKEEDKNPVCYVKPIITMKKKGEKLPDYKEYCTTLAEAEKSTKPLVILPSNDGRFYRREKTDIGLFCAPATNLPEYETISSSFTLALPKIPMSILKQVVSFFRSVNDQHHAEALAYIVYHVASKEYEVQVPPQTTTSMSVEDNDVKEIPDGVIHVLDIHSHHQMSAEFSTIDDCDERATGLYAVLGRINNNWPDITLRASCGGSFFPIPFRDIFDVSATVYPAEWDQRVTFRKYPSPLRLVRNNKIEDGEKNAV